MASQALDTRPITRRADSHVCQEHYKNRAISATILAGESCKRAGFSHDNEKKSTYAAAAARISCLFARVKSDAHAEKESVKMSSIVIQMACERGVSSPLVR